MDFLNLLNAMPGAVAQGLIWGIMAIGVYITYKLLDLADLTVDGTMCTGGAVCIMLMLAGFPAWFAMLIATLAGVVAGAVTGLLHTFLGIPAILAGILTQLGLYSINLRIMDNKANQAINVDKFNLLVSLRYIKLAPCEFAIPDGDSFIKLDSIKAISDYLKENNLSINALFAPGVKFHLNTILVVVLFIIALIAVLYWFFGTEVGASIRSTGANPNMSRAQGINTDLMKIFGLMISNGIVAFASALYAQYQGFGDINAGRGAIVIGLAAVIIAQVIFGKIHCNFAFRLVFVALGGVIYYMVLQVVLWLGLNANDLKLISAIIVALFLAIPHLRDKFFSGLFRKGGNK